MVVDKFAWRKAFSALMGATVLLFAIPGVTVSAAGTDDYPYRGAPNRLDPWGFYTGYCTSFVAFRLSQEGITFHSANATRSTPGEYDWRSRSKYACASHCQSHS